MANYLLLRNNKESGPHSLAELVNAGLKPYDLVWVEGKSAAWRYPGEIEELKPYAPAVEEQPYDRFFKKPVPSGTEKSSLSAAMQANRQPRTETEKEEPYSRYMPPKAVSVTMPGSSSRVMVQKPAARTIIPPVAEEKKTVTPLTVNDKVELDVKFSQPLDDIKEQYIKTLQDRKQKANRNIHLFRRVKVAAIIVGLIGVGIAAGYFLSGKNNNALVAAATPATVVAQEEGAEEINTATPIDEESAVIIPKEEIEKMQSEILPPEKHPQKMTSPLVQDEIQKETRLIVQQQKNEKISKDKNTVSKQPESPAENILNGDRNKKVRDNSSVANDVSPQSEQAASSDELIVKKTRKVNPLEKYVSVSANNYIKVAFGGIRNLELTVTNDSKFVLDNVTVELQYMKPSEQPLRTEMIEFRSIAPNESITKRMQDTNRGIKVNYKIVGISSVQSETASAGF